MAKNTSSKITGQVPKLRGQGSVSYEINMGGDGLELRITDNTESGTFTKDVKLKTVLCCAAPAGTFRTEDLKKAIGSDNNNDAGFLVAVLKHAGVIAVSEEENGTHRLVGFSRV